MSLAYTFILRPRWNDLGLDNYYNAVPETLYDCWIFMFEERPEIELPSYLEKKKLNDETFPELKPRRK